VRPWFAIGGLILAVLALAIAFTRPDRADPDEANPDPSPVAPNNAAERSVSTDLTPVVDLEGAARAAVAAVGTTGDVATAGFISRRELIERFATPEFGSQLADMTSDQLRALASELGARDVDAASMSVVEQPITVATTSTANGARVEVYSVLVVAVPGMGPARQTWRTVTLDMVVRDGWWLVDGWESSPGPTPALAAEVTIDTADDVAARLGWKRVGGGR
jgi:hypothetical protein